jgi:pyridoxal phosphate enzyme (YggS family)
LPKLAELHDLAIVWHYIGPLQSNKTRVIAAHFAWVHSLDRLSIAQRLSVLRPADLPPLQVCLQVNVSGEDSKSGVAAADIGALAAAVSALPNLTLRGLMAIPAPTDDEVAQRAAFAQVAHIQQTLNQQGYALDTLSMGMSHDFPAAIAEGATIVRVGTAIFGARG